MPTLSDITKITATIKDGNKLNFQCDGFAKDFQTKLNDAHIPFQGKLLAFRRSNIDEAEGVKIEEALGSDSVSYNSKKHNINIPKAMRAYPKIILHDADHQLNDEVVGNQTHFWTELTMSNGDVYCFDNNHPAGVEKHKFYNSLQFSIELFLPKDPKPDANSLLSHRDLSARTVFGDNSHHYKNHQEIIANKHLLLVDTSVEEFRDKLKDEVDWQYYSVQKLDNKSFHYEFIDAQKLKALSSPPVQLQEDNIVVELHNKEVLHDLKHSLQDLKAQHPEEHLNQSDLKSQFKKMHTVTDDESHSNLLSNN